MLSKTFFTTISLAAVIQADFDPEAKLTKPALVDNFDYLKDPMLAVIPTVPATVEQWGGGWIPQDCASLAQDNNLSAADVTAYNVKYTDVCSVLHDRSVFAVT